MHQNDSRKALTVDFSFTTSRQDEGKNFPRVGRGGCAFRSPRPGNGEYGVCKGCLRVCRPTAAASTFRRRRYAYFPVHSCFVPQLFGGARRRQKSRLNNCFFVHTAQSRRVMILRGSLGDHSARRGIMPHLSILVGGTGPTESIPAVAGRAAHLWRATTHVRVPLPVPRGGCANRDKSNYRSARDGCFRTLLKFSG